MRKICLTLSVFLMATSAFAASDSCGSLEDIVFDVTNPAGAQLQITLVNDKKKRIRESISEALSQRPETIQLLLQAQDNQKLKICLTNNAEGKGFQAIGLLKK